MYSNSGNNTKIDDSTVKSQSKIIWFAMQAGIIALGVCIPFMEMAIKQEPIMPESRLTFIGLCVFAIPLSFLLMSRLRRMEQTIRDNQHIGQENTPEQLQRYITFIVFGMALAELPAMFAIVLYIMTGEFMLSLFFILVSFVIGFFYKPAL